MKGAHDTKPLHAAIRYFSDSESVHRANDLIAALASLGRTAVLQAMSDLLSVDQGHKGLPSFQLLCDFVEHRDCRCDRHDLEAIVAEEQLIREDIVPASAVMGSAGNGLIRECWNTLAEKSESAGVPFENQHCFSAELYLCAQRYDDFVRTAKEIPGADMYSAAQRWLALAYGGCKNAERARESALRFAWLSPEEFDGLLDELGDAELSQDWDKFQTDLDELDATWFPAWCALEKKSGTAIADNFPLSDGSCAYRLVMRLVPRERGGVHCKDDRARLKNLNESFFAFYLMHQDKLHLRKR